MNEQKPTWQIAEDVQTMFRNEIRERNQKSAKARLIGNIIIVIAIVLCCLSVVIPLWLIALR